MRTLRRELTGRKGGEEKIQHSPAATGGPFQIAATVATIILVQTIVHFCKDQPAGGTKFLAKLGAVLDIALVICERLGWGKVVEVTEAISPITEVRSRNFWDALKWL